MNNNEKKKNSTKKKNNKTRDYELETYFKKSNINKNNQNKKNNKKKYKYNNGNTVKVTKVLVSDEFVVNEIKDKKPIKEEILVKKKEKTKKEVKNKKILINDNKDLEKKLEKQNKETKDLLKTNPSLKKTVKTINSDLRKERVKGYLKESLIFTLIILLINIIVYFLTDKISFLRLFDIEYLNIIVTITLFMILLFIGNFLIDFLLSELFRFIKLRKSKVNKVNTNNKSNNKRRSGGDSYRNQGINKGKRQENCKVKK